MLPQVWSLTQFRHDCVFLVKNMAFSGGYHSFQQLNFTQSLHHGGAFKAETAPFKGS